MAYVHYISRQHLDVTGVPYDGGRIYYYKSNSTEHAEAYVDVECTRLHPWPIVLDSRGNCEVYVKDDDPVRWELYDSQGNYVETWDCIPLGQDIDPGEFATKKDLDKVDKKATEIDEELERHSTDKFNPHQVTAAQVGAYTKEEVDAEIKKESDARELYDSQLRESIEALEEKTGDFVTGEEVSAAISAEADARIQEDIAINARIDMIPQTDWDEEDEGSMAYLQNHPTPISDLDIEALFS